MIVRPGVHAAALVSEDAVLAEGVEVGPFAIVEEDVVVGPGTRIRARAHLRPGTRLGAGCDVHMGAIVGHDPQDLGFSGERTGVVVGDRTVIREHATIHRSTRTDRPTRIGSDCFIMAGAHVAHDGQVGDRVILCNGALLAGHVHVDDRAFVSGNVVIHQFVRIGALAMLSGNTAVGMDAGPFALVSGRNAWRALNIVGMRRAGMPTARRERVKAAYRTLFTPGLPLAEGLRRVAEEVERTPEIDAILAFYSESRRGCLRPAFTSGSGEADDG